MSNMINFSSNSDEPQENTTHWTEELTHEDFMEYKVSVIIWEIFPAFIFLVGGFGNIATICVMRRIKDHNSSQHVILMSLAMSDLSFLCVIISFDWVFPVFDVSVVYFHVALCKLYIFMLYASGTTSAWLVTCVTVQRTMAVLWPHRMRVMCTVRRTWIVIATLVISVCALYSHILIGYELTEENGCYAVEGAYLHFFEFVFSWIDLCAASFFPSACQFACDVILSVSLFKAVSSSSSMAARVESNANTAHSTDSRRKTSSRATVMVLILSCAFLVLTLPICVYVLWYTYNYDAIVEDPQTDAFGDLLRAITHQMWFTNSAINFGLYCLTGTKFRREFLHWIRCGTQTPPAPSVHRTASESGK